MRKCLLCGTFCQDEPCLDGSPDSHRPSHDIEEAIGGVFHQVRCLSCPKMPTIVRQRDQTDEVWDAQRDEFLREHPQAVPGRPGA